MKRNRVIIAITIVLLLTVFFLVSLLHYASRKEVISRFQEQQLLHAHHIAEQIETFFRGHAMVLRSFSTPISLQHESMEQLRLDLQAYSREMANNSIRSVFLQDESGRTIYSSDDGTVGLNDGRGEILLWCRNPENRHKVFVHPLIRGAQDRGIRTERAQYMQNLPLQFLLSVPLYDEVIETKDLKRKEKLLGILSFTVELKPLLYDELHDAPMIMRDAWIIEQGGMVLFHSNHPKMEFPNNYQRDKSCNQCHDSFDYVKEILEKKEGTISFEKNASLKKLAGLATMKFENASWIVVTDSEDERVTSFMQASLRNYLILLGIVVLILGGGSALIIRNYRAKECAEEETRHLQEIIIERKKVEEMLRASEERLRFISSQILYAQEQERRRISRELHDEVGPALATLKLRLGLIGKKARTDQNEIREECEQTLEYLDQMVENVRRLSRDLSPAALEHFGLSTALRRLLSDFSKDYHVEVSIDMSEDIDRFFSQEAQTIIYRIFQEIMHNVGKHAHATHLSVNAVRQNGAISFMFEDNGKGFDMNAVEMRDVDRKGLGLDILEERVRMLGGLLDVSSQEGKGTRITFRVPVLEKGDT